MSWLLLFLGALLSLPTAHGAAYYSTGAPVVATPARSCTVVGLAQVCTGSVEVHAAGAVNGLALAASVYVPITGANAVLRFRLSHAAPGGYRAGVLVSTASSLVGANLLGTITLRTYLSTAPNPGMARDVQMVSGTLLQAQLLAGRGLPQQLELSSTQPFDEVEIEFEAALSLGLVVDVRYAYGVGPNRALPLTGYLSRFDPATTSLATKYAVSGTCANVWAPELAVDNDLTNFATFASLATINCDGQLRVKLNGTAPGTYRAGFVVGRTNNLLDAGILTNLVLRTYYQGAPVEQASAGTTLLALSLLPDGRALVSFQATQTFDEVAIERTGLVTLLDNLQLYFWVGLEARVLPPTVYSSFSAAAGHFQVYKSGVACVNCGVLNPDSAAGPDLNEKATIQKTAGAVTAIGLRLDLNGAGRAGNRAGVVLGRSSALDVATLQYVTIATYNEANQLLETASGAPLLTLTVLPNNRRSISFNTTANFAKVSIRLASALSALDTNDVFYAFADSTDGTFRLTPPASPLPVTLTSFGVRRPVRPGPAEVTWATASELHSAYFVVERTADPAAGFQAIGRVAAAGNSVVPRQYHLLDTQADPGTTLYYRLRQVDEDGTTTLSAVAVLTGSPVAAGFSLYPNPVAAAAGQVTLRVGPALAPGANVSVYSGSGQLLYSQELGATSPDGTLVLPTTGLAAGLYQVVLRDASGRLATTQRLVVKE